MPLETKAIDFVVYDQRGQVVLLAEAKSRSGTSDAWASQLRRNILAHGVLPEALFFLIATPDRIYIWKQQRAGAPEAAPDLTVNARNVLASYFDQLNRPASEITPEAFEVVVLSWLNDLADSSFLTVSQDPSLRWLSESGFVNSIRNARIEHLA